MGPAASALFVAEAIDRVKTKTMHSAEFREKIQIQFSTPDGVPIHPLKGPPSEESICFISCEKRRVTIRARLDLSPRLRVKPTDTDRGYHLDRGERPYCEYGLQSTTPLQVRYSSPLTEAGFQGRHCSRQFYPNHLFLSIINHSFIHTLSIIP